MIAKLIGLLIGLAIVVGFSAALAALLWLAWSFVFVPVFHAPALTFPQVWVGMIAVNILFNAIRR